MKYGLFLFILVCSSFLIAQQSPSSSPAAPGANEPSEKSSLNRDVESNESSSRDTRVDIAPPKDDAKNHPGSKAAVAEAEDREKTDAENASREAGPAPSDVQEFHPWNPYKAGKDVEVGDFYFKRKNYRAALARYQDALVWKNDDAMANFRLAECYEKLDQPDEAATHYEQYLKILPHGPQSEDARKALARLKPAVQKNEARKSEAAPSTQ